jgi:hypothetical protein
MREMQRSGGFSTFDGGRYDDYLTAWRFGSREFIRHPRNPDGCSSSGGVTLAVQLFARLASTVSRET